MKNSLKFLLVVFFSSYVFNFSLGNELKFEASKIELLENQNIVKASGKIKIFLNNETEIDAEKLIYNKKKSLGVIEEDVKINDRLNDLQVYSKKIEYFKEDEIIKSDYPTKIIFENNYIINLNSFHYDRKNFIITSDSPSSLKDKSGNEFSVDEFVFQINDNLLKSKSLKYKDFENNKLSLNSAIINFNDNSILGKDIEIDFYNSSSGMMKNEPRMKARSAFIYNQNTKLNKVVYTTCKKSGKCPAWQIQSEEVFHNKKDKTINYKNAWLKFYDKPVIYFPKFYHPDPTVKRQSGFLIPSFAESNNLGLGVTIPYYKVIAENKDLTFSPKLFSDGSAIFQNEYRQKNKNNSHIIDFGLLLTPKSGENSKTHLFSRSNFDLNLLGLDESQIKINLEQVSNDTYLKNYQITSPIIASNSTLKSSINFLGKKNDLNFETSLEVYEDLNKEDTDRYEYIFPKFDITKSLNSDYESNGSFNFASSGYRRLYDTNITENILINDLTFSGYPIIDKKGFVSKYDFIVKNVNSESRNSSNYKNELDKNLMALMSFESRMPMLKKHENGSNHLIPKSNLKFSPNKTKSKKNEDRLINVNNIYSLNRIGANDTIEGGVSLTLGVEYKKFNNLDKEFFNFEIASSLRAEENQDLPINSTLGKKTSDFFGKTSFEPNDFFKLEYDFALDNNLDTLNYNHFKNEIIVNNFFNTFEFFERSDYASNESYLKNTAGINIDQSNSIRFETRRNKVTNFTEYYNLIYEYSNDCLRASLEYNKNYYSDRDLKPEDNLLFKIAIIPFANSYTSKTTSE